MSTNMIAEAIRDILIENNQCWPDEVYRQLAGRLPGKRSYLTVIRLMKALVEIGLIEFVRPEPGTELLDRRLYRVKPGYEDDPRWKEYPLHILYPGTRLGSIEYKARRLAGLAVPTRRAPEYAKD